MAFYIFCDVNIVNSSWLWFVLLVYRYIFCELSLSGCDTAEGDLIVSVINVTGIYDNVLDQ
jgi:hypothetical protein